MAGYLRDLQGFDDATRRARVTHRRRVVAFLRQFPEMFNVTSTRGRGEVTTLYILYTTTLKHVLGT
ncbi:hypothetical protein N9L68_06285 [bacterium]|nr:hypothetical protein [bacterium]